MQNLPGQPGLQTTGEFALAIALKFPFARAAPCASARAAASPRLAARAEFGLLFAERDGLLLAKGGWVLVGWRKKGKEIVAHTCSSFSCNEDWMEKMADWSPCCWSVSISTMGSKLDCVNLEKKNKEMKNCCYFTHTKKKKLEFYHWNMTKGVFGRLALERQLGRRLWRVFGWWRRRRSFSFGAQKVWFSS